MSLRHYRSVSRSCLGFALALAAFVGGCNTAGPARPRSGNLELVVGAAGDAPYALVGRFQLTGISARTTNHREVDMDVDTSQALLELPAGSYALALADGARLVCRNGEWAAPGRAAPEQAVATREQVIVIEPERTTTARILFGSVVSNSARALEDSSLRSCARPSAAAGASALLLPL